MPSPVAARVFVVGAAGWITGAVVALAWILSYILGDPSSETASDAGLALIVTSPLYLVALLGVAILIAGRGARRLSLGALAWSVVACGLGLLASAEPISFVWTIVTTGGAQLTPDADWIATYPQDGATYYLYGQDLLPLWFAFWGLVALAAAIWYRRGGLSKGTAAIDEQRPASF